MIVEIENVLNSDQLEKVRSIFRVAEWSEGKSTAGAVLKDGKFNLEVKAGTTHHRELSKIVMLALAGNTEVEMAISPTGSSIPIFSKYTQGMRYPEHLDAPIVSYKNPSGSIFPARFRSDVSATLFLSEPDEYEGGELVINSPSGERRFKAPTGSLITYPSNYLHEITEVTGGERRVAVFWFQSLYQDTEARFQLYNLRRAADSLLSRFPQDEDVKSVNATLNKLMQMFAG
jgi:PKHD-type hydroxylase